MNQSSKDFCFSIVSENQLHPQLDDRIRQLLCICFPDGYEFFSKSRHWHGSAPSYSLFFEQSGKVLGHVGIIVRHIQAGASKIEIAGIQNMAVAPELRGSGVAQRIMKESMKEAEQQGIKLGVLFCVPKLEKFYASVGWRKIEADVQMTYEGKKGPIPGKNICMVLEMGKEKFPEGSIDLLGADW